jgi:hypothetical protein
MENFAEELLFGKTKSKEVTVNRAHLEAVLEYMYHDERKNWLECDKPNNHIFLSVRVLQEELDA